MKTRVVLLVAALAGAGAFATTRLIRRDDDAVLLAPMRFETATGTARIYTVKRESGYWERILEIDGAEQSAMFLDRKLRDELVFKYHKVYGRIFDFTSDVRNVLMLGGGGCAWPKYLVTHYPNVTVDVVEFDHVVIDIAMRYFDVARFVGSMDEGGKLTIIEDDARHYVQAAKKTYDVIVNDCFVGLSSARDLVTLEAVTEVKSILNPNGVYAANILGAREGERSGHLRAVIATLQHAFAHVYVFACDPGAPTAFGNHIIIATDSDVNASNMEPTVRFDDALVLHDPA